MSDSERVNVNGQLYSCSVVETFDEITEDDISQHLRDAMLPDEHFVSIKKDLAQIVTTTLRSIGNHDLAT